MSDFTPELLEDPKCAVELSPKLMLLHLKNNQIVIVVDTPKAALVLDLGKDPDKLLAVAGAFAHMSDHLRNPHATEEEVLQISEDLAAPAETEDASSIPHLPHTVH